MLAKERYILDHILTERGIDALHSHWSRLFSSKKFVQSDICLVGRRSMMSPKMEYIKA